MVDIFMDSILYRRGYIIDWDHTEPYQDLLTLGLGYSIGVRFLPIYYSEDPFDFTTMGPGIILSFLTPDTPNIHIYIYIKDPNFCSVVKNFIYEKIKNFTTITQIEHFFNNTKRCYKIDQDIILGYFNEEGVAI